MVNFDLTNLSPLVAILSSLVAVLIAITTLWLTHLRGARIGLLEEPEIEVKELPNDRFKSGVPYILELKDISLLFINAGNRAGVIKDITLKFEPNKNFKPFFVKIHSSVNYQQTSQSNSLFSSDHLIIRERSVGIITIDIHYLELNRMITRDLKDVEWASSDIKSESLVTLIEKLLEYKKEKLENFVEFLSSNKKLGNLEIYYTCTGKRWLLREEGLKTKSLPLELNNEYKETAKRYRNLLDRWGEIEPTTDEIIGDVSRFIDECSFLINLNEKVLKTPCQEDNLYRLENVDSMKEIQEKWQYKFILRWNKYKKFIEEVVSLFEKFIEFDSKVEIALSTNMPSTKEYQIDLAEKCRKDIEQKLDDILPQLRKIREELDSELKDIIEKREG